MNNVLATRLLPLIKYPGGKEKELNYIIPALPAKIDNYYEPFVLLVAGLYILLLMQKNIT